MKIISTIILSFCNLTILAQTINNVQIEYEVYNNTDMPTIYNSVLWVDVSQSLYQEKTSTSRPWTERLKKEEGEQTIVEPLTAFEPYLKVDNQQKKVLFYDLIGANTFLISDTYTAFKWDITKETKTIAGYVCCKAVTNFRGRQWNAWFTAELPLSFGPWKLYGLPGLILEATDVTTTYSIKAISVKSYDGSMLNADFSKLMDAKNKHPITLKQFDSDFEEYKDNASKRISNRLGGMKTERIKIPREGLELKYEWE